MIYEKYAKMASEHGIKLTEPIGPEILHNLTQSEIFDVIWGAQTTATENLSTDELSIKVMAEIRRLAPMLLSLPAFKIYSGDKKKLENRVKGHYSFDKRHTGFIERQDIIAKKLGLEKNTKSFSTTSFNKRTNPPEQYLPDKEYSERAYKMVTRPGQPVSVDAVLDQIEINAKKDGLVLKDNWRIITERNIEIWSNTAKKK
jgi:hypothetical protein